MFTVRTAGLATIGMLAVAWAIAQETLPGPDPLASAPPTDERHYSYAVGRQIGSSFRRDGLKLDLENLLAGVKDGLSGGPTKISDELCAVSIERLVQAQTDAFRKRNADFLAENAKVEGVVVLPSGLQYKVLGAGKGAGRTPTMQDTVVVRYAGRLIDGTVFDQTDQEPAEMPMKILIPGWTQALQKMKPGDKWQLVVPAQLGYGESGRGEIPPHATLVFDVELVGVR